MRRAPNIRRVSFRALVASALVLAVGSGCAGSDDDISAKARTPSSGGVAAVGGQALIDAQAEYARCMRRQGVDLPGPGERSEFDPATSGVSQAELREAESHCERERRAIAEAAPTLSDSDRRAAFDAGLAYARCMREQGQHVPDPRLSDEGGGTAVELPPDAKENPAFQAATKVCERHLREPGVP
jgi:hypothetical protein